MSFHIENFLFLLNFCIYIFSSFTIIISESLSDTAELINAHAHSFSFYFSTLKKKLLFDAFLGNKHSVSDKKLFYIIL